MGRLAGVVGLLALGAACEAPPWHEATRVEGLRVATVVVTPPEAAAGDLVTSEVHLLDPDDGPRDLLVWTCTAFAGGCVEAGSGQVPLEAWTAVVRDAGPVERVRFRVPEAAGALLGVEPARYSVVQWTLACRPGVCPILDAVAAAPPPGSAAWRDVVRDLAGPGAWLRELPLEGASLAARTLVLTNLPPWDRNENPRVTRVDRAPLEVEPGGTLALQLEVSEGWVYPLATGGGFTAREVARNGLVPLTWIAPDAPGPVDLLVAVEDGVGGAAVWRDVALVR